MGVRWGRRLLSLGHCASYCRGSFHSGTVQKVCEFSQFTGLTAHRNTRKKYKDSWKSRRKQACFEKLAASQGVFIRRNPPDCCNRFKNSFFAFGIASARQMQARVCCGHCMPAWVVPEAESRILVAIVAYSRRYDAPGGYAIFPRLALPPVFSP